MRNKTRKIVMYKRFEFVGYMILSKLNFLDLFITLHIIEIGLPQFFQPHKFEKIGTSSNRLIFW